MKRKWNGLFVFSFLQVGDEEFEVAKKKPEKNHEITHEQFFQICKCQPIERMGMQTGCSYMWHGIYEIYFLRVS